MSATEGSPAGARRIKALFVEVCDLATPAQQLARLYELAATPDEIERVRALLQHDDGHTTRFSAPVAHMVAAAAGPELRPGDVLGRWTLVREIGQGGMGTVFEAARSDGHYRQRSAVKVLRGLSGDLALRQLAQERQVLASLNHPNIARLLDGGTTPAGNPYLVMEYVDGVRIDEHLRQRGLGLGAALALFITVCDAVAHAHAQLVVHCDIKPANVLVDSEGRVRLLDFGIAQLQGQGRESTSAGLQAMTPRYASPEQRAGGTPTPATDIYSLGRLLQALVQPLALTHRRSHELDAVIARATAEEPAQRHPSAAALQDDVRSLLAHRPVSALAGRRGYVARKALRRHWPWAVAGLTAVLMAGGFTLRLVHERDRAQAAEAAALVQRERAQTEAANAREVNRFVIGLFESADTSASGWADLRATELLAQGRLRVLRELADHPLQQALLLATLGTVQENIGDFPAASLAYRDAIALEGPQRLNRVEEEADLQFRLAFSEVRQGRFTAAEAAARRAVALRDAQQPPNAGGTADAHNALGVVLTNRRLRLDEARGHLEQALKLQIASRGGDSYQVGQVLGNLSVLEVTARRWSAAEDYARRAVAVGEKQAQPVHLYRHMIGLALAQAGQERWPEASATIRRSAELCEARYGPANLYCLRVLRDEGDILLRAARPADALRVLRTAHQVAQTAGDTRNVLYALLLSRLARALAGTGDGAGAAAMHRTAVEAADAHGERDDLTRAEVLLHAAAFLAERGQRAQAEPLLEQARSVQAAGLPEDHPQQALARCLHAQLQQRRDAAWRCPPCWRS